MSCSDLFKGIKIKKTARRAYGVNGEPVVTLGVAEILFKIGGLTFAHEFIILRGLIHPMLLGMDFLRKCKAKIDVGDAPRVQLSHPSGKFAFASFIKSMPKRKPLPHIALVKEVEIPPMSYCYADAYVANVESITAPISEKPERLLGITSVQKENDFFDPGFLLRDAVVPSNAEVFKVELMNPWEKPIKIADDTPVGAIFDYDCEVRETDGAESSLWEEEPADEAESLMRRQTLLSASISVVDVDQAPQGAGPEGPKGDWKANHLT